MCTIFSAGSHARVWSDERRWSSTRAIGNFYVRLFYFICLSCSFSFSYTISTDQTTSPNRRDTSKRGGGERSRAEARPGPAIQASYGHPWLCNPGRGNSWSAGTASHVRSTQTGRVGQTSTSLLFSFSHPACPEFLVKLTLILFRHSLSPGRI